MAAHHAIWNADILTEPGWRTLQRDTIIVRIAYHITHHHFMTPVQIECIVIIVVAIDDSNSINHHTITRQPMLHPASWIPKRNAFQLHITTLYKAQQMGSCDAFIVPWQFRERLAATVNNTFTVNSHILHIICPNQLYSRCVGAQRDITGPLRCVVIDVCTSIKHSTFF